MGKHKDKHKSKDKSKKKKKKRSRSASVSSDEDVRRAEKRRRKEDDSILGYTNEDNPFGDVRLTDKFVWGKKEQVKPSQKGSRREEKDRKQKVMEEIRKVKDRREEREAETAMWEEEKLRMMRERESMNYRDWEAKEEQFHKQTNFMRSQIRIREGRSKPIDRLAKNLSLVADGDYDIEEPTSIFSNLSLPELEDLEKDITMYQEHDPHTEFWQALMVVCQEELREARLAKAVAEGQSSNARLMGGSGLSSAVEGDIETEMRSKSYSDLMIMEVQIEDTLKSGGVDVEFWDAILKKVKVQKARARLREIHSAALSKRLDQLRKVQSQEVAEAMSSMERAAEATVAIKSERSSRSPIADPEDGASSAGEEDMNLPRAFSPDLMEEEAGAVAPEDDEKQLARQRAAVLERIKKTGMAKAPVGVPTTAAAPKTSEDRLFDAVANEAPEKDEEQFSEEVALQSQVYWWQDKYRPRKPRYFNRVHTGYDWNKYNQVHFDHDNPPPKTIQGYKFNIFYPDLIDKSKTPTYTVIPSKDNETATITFHAGPPYEDIAFTIVNREWETSHRYGFKCCYERGILHLYVRFKRMRYRR